MIELVMCDTALELVRRAQAVKSKLSAPSGLSYKLGIAFLQPHKWHTPHIPPENHPENLLRSHPSTAMFSDTLWLHDSVLYFAAVMALQPAKQ